MCGIAGTINKNEKHDDFNFNKIKRMMFSRGPDQQGKFLKKTKNLYIQLYSSRLKIIDIENKESDQPFIFENIKLIFNGEIYNYLEIRKELASLGHKFKTNSDTEVLAQSYFRWGIDCIKKFDGMWSFCIYDEKENKIILSRDFFGEKPLFYYFNEKNLIFGSEINYLKFFKPSLYQINYKKVNDFLVNGYKSIFSNSETYFKNIYFLKPGEILELDLKNFKKKNIKIDIFKKENVPSNEIELNEMIRERFLNSYKKRLRSDVPVNFCLSGGIDSSSLVSIAKKKFDIDPECYSIINNDERYNEYENIKYLEEELKLKVNYIDIPKLSFEKFLEKCNEMINYRKAPIATISYYIHSFISQKCKNNNGKVILSGTGADELFTGYYDHHLFFLNEIKDKNIFNDELQKWKKFTEKTIRNKKLKLENFLNNPFFRDHIYSNDDNKFKISDYSLFSEKNYDDNNLKNRMKNEIFHETVPVILYEDDMNSMRHSIENRSPFLSKDLYNLLFSINSSKFIKYGYPKYILRDIVKGYLPDKIRLNRKKIGFNASISDITQINYDIMINFINSNKYLKEIVNEKNFDFLKNFKTISNEQSKYIFNIINVGMFIN